MAAYGAGAAIASGVLSAVGTILGIIAFALASTDDHFDPVPLLAQATAVVSGFAALAALPLAARFHRTWRLRAARDSAVVFVLAVASLLVLAVVDLAYAADISLRGTTALIGSVASVGVGAWLIAASVRRASVVLAGTQRQIGAAIGIARVWALPVYLLSGPQTDGFVPLPVAVIVVLFGGLLAFLLTTFAYPVWAIRLGRELLRTED